MHLTRKLRCRSLHRHTGRVVRRTRSGGTSSLPDRSVCSSALGPPRCTATGRAGRRRLKARVTWLEGASRRPRRAREFDDEKRRAGGGVPRRGGVTPRRPLEQKKKKADEGVRFWGARAGAARARARPPRRAERRTICGPRLMKAAGGWRHWASSAARRRRRFAEREIGGRGKAPAAAASSRRPPPPPEPPPPPVLLEPAWGRGAPWSRRLGRRPVRFAGTPPGGAFYFPSRRAPGGRRTGDPSKKTGGGTLATPARTRPKREGVSRRTRRGKLTRRRPRPRRRPGPAGRARPSWPRRGARDRCRLRPDAIAPRPGRFRRLTRGPSSGPGRRDAGGRRKAERRGAAAAARGLQRRGPARPSRGRAWAAVTRRVACVRSARSAHGPKTLALRARGARERSVAQGF